MSVSAKEEACGTPVQERIRRLGVRVRHGLALLGFPDDHAVSVAEWAHAIAEQLGLASGDRAVVVEGAFLHDVGKSRISRAILEKPAALTAAELREVRRHPLHGERMVWGVVDPSVARVVRSHHERWDGTGYPDGLVGLEIPIAARVVAVADAFLAMIEERPYRASRSVGEALEELRAGAGTQFDAACVAALTAVAPRAEE